MNKSAIQKYAIWARTEMIAQVEQRAYQYGVTKDGYGEENAVTIMGRALTNQEQEQRWDLIQQIKRKGYTQVIEEVAYTWFNRFIALRFMEVNNYLPTHIRVFSDSAGAFKPEILSSALQVELDGLDRTRVAQMIDTNQSEDLYRYLLLTQCNALNEALPKMFEKMGGYTELLLPNNILKVDGILGRLICDIPEEDWNVTAESEECKGQVQIIGWMYQFYNTELNEQVYDGNMSKSRITKELLPAATTIYTPDWPVQYMVQNSLGKLWLEHHHDNELKTGWKYYLDEADQTHTVKTKLAAIRAKVSNVIPEEITILDPCMGSGHILVYAFDVLVQIYKSYGISERDAAKLILEKNLYGLDIDDRAAQLAYFAVMMKARQYDRRIFSRGVQPKVFAIQESNDINRNHLKFFGTCMTDSERKLALKQVVVILDEFNDAKEYGSILNVSKQDWELLYRFIQDVDSSVQVTVDAMGLEDTKARLLELVKIAAVMAQKYDVVITNPPYLSNARFSVNLDRYVKEYYEDVKHDLSMVMYKKAIVDYTKPLGFTSFITTTSWMYLSSFEKLRNTMNSLVTILSLVDYGTELFDGKVGHNPIVSWTIQKLVIDYQMTAVRLVDYCYSKRDKKEPEFFNKHNHYVAKQSSFQQISGSPIAYWVPQKLFDIFREEKQIGNYGDARVGMQTGENEKFVRLWSEVEYPTMLTDAHNAEEAKISGCKWFPYNKGGDFRKWYGNNDWVVDWYNDGQNIKEDKLFKLSIGKCLPSNSKPKNMQYYFLPSITWSKISSGSIAFRYKPAGHIFDIAGASIFPQEGWLKYLHGYCNSKVAMYIASVLSPTINYEAGTVSKFPVVVDQNKKGLVENIVTQNIHISMNDYNAFETSWDFLAHPLVTAAYVPDWNGGHLTSIRDSYVKWEALCEKRFKQLKSNEEELNRIFIDTYGLQDELTPEVEDKDVTVRKADLGRDIRSLISYAVGCMFGRYSLDEPGIAYAGGEWDTSKFSTIAPDKDNIIPIGDNDYFDDDITARFFKWIETVYGKDTLEENLKFIASALGGKGTPREVIRNYFLNDFYADHLKIYQKRPIYWLFDSGKKNGFKALIYMHRYQSDLLARMRIDYVHEMQERYRTQLAHLNDAVAHASTSERVKLNKQLRKIQDQALELHKYEERIHHLADQNISIDLDDGVKHNYALFGDVLAKIK